MAKLTLTDITSGYNLVTAYNANNDAVEAAIENTVSLDGTSPNEMLTNLSMGGYRLTNLGAPTNQNDAVRLIDVANIANGGAISVSATVAWASDITGIPTLVSSLGVLAAPASDKLMFWDQSASGLKFLTLGAGLSIVGTTISSTASSVDWAGVTSIPTYVTSLGALSDPNADRLLFWDDSSSAIQHLVVGTGLAVSGTNITLSFLGLEALSDPNVDRILFWDDSASATGWLSVGTGLSITGTTISLGTTLTSLGALADPNVDKILFWDDSANNYAYLAPTGHLSITGTDIAYSSTSGTYTGTLTGVTTTVTGPINYKINGSVCTLEITADMVGAANSTAHTITGGPVAMRPAAIQTVQGVTCNNSVDAFGKITIGTDGTLTLHNVLSAVFTGTGTEGARKFTVTYPLT